MVLFHYDNVVLNNRVRDHLQGTDEIQDEETIQLGEANTNNNEAENMNMTYPAD